MKTKSIIIVVVMVLIAQSVSAEWFKPLSEDQQKMEALFIGMVFIDWMQTKEFRALEVKEMNQILGPEPSQERVDVYFLSSIISHVLITWALPTNKWKDTFQRVSVFVEGFVVAGNYMNGYGPKLNIAYNFKF